MDPRYEWRVWGAGCDGIEERVGPAAVPVDRRSGVETYIVSIRTTSTNPKIRDDLLDVKVLRATAHGFEQWEPLEKRPFPITVDATADLVRRLGFASPTDRARYTCAQLLAEVIEPESQLEAVEVRKHRRLFSYAGCIVELSDVSIAGAELTSVAVESADLAALRNTAESLGLTAAPNVSYPKMIHRVLGWVDREE